MKVISKIAVCGLLSLTLSTAAHAQAAAVSQRAVQAMNQSATAKQFLQSRLGVRPGASAADVNAALARLGSAERTAALSAINAFSNKAVVTGDSSAISANETLAKSIFSASNGQLIDLAKSTSTTASRDAVVAGEKLACSSVLDPSAMAAGTKVSFVSAQAVIKAGIVKRGKCETDPVEMSADARGNLLEYGEGKLKGLSSVEAMKAAFADDGVNLSDEQALIKINSIAEKCAYVSPVASR